MTLSTFGTHWRLPDRGRLLRMIWHCRTLVRTRSLAVLLLALWALGGCGRTAEENLVVASDTPFILISIDTLRSDHLPAYGYSGVETPAIDRLREDGLLFTRAYTPVPLTLPAHASLMTGLLPTEHGVRDNIGYQLADDIPNLATVFRSQGYRTGAAVSGIVLRRETGIGVGFDDYDDLFDTDELAVLGEIQRTGTETARAANAWLRQNADRPIFFFFHLYDPHTPYEPPAPFASRFSSPYDGEIAAADRAVGDLLQTLDNLGLYERSVILLTSDHGEGLDDHGESEHGILLYRESLQVPLILKLPSDRMAGQTVTAPAQLTDVAPTFLSLIGVPIPSTMSGIPLLELAVGDAPDRALYSETYYPRLRLGWSGLRSLIQGPFHYIHGPDPELYDLQEDPNERRSILRENRRDFGRLKNHMQQIEARLEPPNEAEPEIQEALMALGYLGSSPRIAEDEPLPDPKSRIHTLESLDEGMAAFRAGDAVAAVPLLRSAVDQNPQLIVGWQFLGLALLQTGQPQEAYESLAEAFQLSNGAPQMAQSLAAVALEIGRIEDGEAYLRIAIQNKPDDVRLRLVRGRALLELGRPEEALEVAREARLQQPRNADAVYLCGTIKMGLGQLNPAEVDLRQALELAPDHTAALSDLAVLLASQDRDREAREFLQRLLQLRPGDRTARQLWEEIETEG